MISDHDNKEKEALASQLPHYGDVHALLVTGYQEHDDEYYLLWWQYLSSEVSFSFNLIIIQYFSIA